MNNTTSGERALGHKWSRPIITYVVNDHQNEEGIATNQFSKQGKTYRYKFKWGATSMKTLTMNR